LINLAGAAGEELIRLRAKFPRQHDEELSSATSAEQNFGESEFGQKSARKYFAQQRDPVRTPVEVGGRPEQELINTVDFSLQEDLNRHQET
jgi:hypothetical protein